jgi:hypothetical protein
MIESIGVALIATGVGVLLWTLRKYANRPRGSGITSDMVDMLVMPHYERIARGYARIYGYPESEWPRFQHRAIAEIIKQAR